MVEDAADVLAGLARLRAASRAFAQAVGVDAVVESLVQRSLEAFDAQGALVAIVAPDDTLEVLASTWGAIADAYDGVPISRPLPLTDAARGGEAVLLGSYADLATRYPELADKATAAAWAALPLRVGDRIIGALAIGFSRPQAWDEAQRLYLLTLADLCAIVVDRRILAERRAESQLRALIDSNVVGVIGGDDRYILEANDAFLSTLGLDRAALTNGLEQQAILGDTATAENASLVAGDGSHRFGPYERELLHADGQCVPVRIVGAVISSAGRGRWIALVEDLTDDRRVAAELRAREARYRSLVEASDTMVWTADAVGDFAEPNEAWSAYTGQSMAEYSGQGWLSALHPDDRKPTVDALDDARREGRALESAMRLHHAASGTHRHVIVRAVPLCDDEGGPTEWIGTIDDVEDYVRTDAVLQATRARLEALMHNAPVGFAFIDQQLRFQVVNEKLAEINGLPADAHLGRDVREVVPDLAEVNESLFRRVLRGEPILEAEVRGATPADPNRPRDWLVNYYPVRDDTHGAILGIGATVIDVTERNELLAAERDARTAAEATARLSEALSTMTAEIVNAPDDEAIAQLTGEGLASVFDADGVLVVRRDIDGRHPEVLFAHGYGSDDVAALLADPQRETWSTSRVLPGRTPVFYEFPEQYLAQYPSRSSFVEQFGARAWTVGPLMAGDQVMGFFVVMFQKAHRFTAVERGFITTVGDVVAQAMLRARSRSAEALARRSAEMLAEAIAGERARLAAILHRMPAGLVVVDAMTGIPRVVLSNTRAIEILGPPPADDAAEAWLALRALDGSPIPADASPLQRALRGDELSDNQDSLVVREDGTTSRIRATAVPIRDSDQRVTSAVIVIEDVTELARRERDAQLLARVSDLLGSSGEVGDLLERVVALAVPSFADLCGVYVLADDELHLFAVADREPNRAERVQHLLAEPIPLGGDTPVATAVRRGQSMMLTRVPDTIETRDLGTAQRDWVRHVLQPSSVLVVPLRSGERVTGALTFSQTEDTGRVFTAYDLDVAIELGTRCALLLEQVVAHRETARARDRADRLQRFAAAMARAATVDAVVEAIASEGLEAVGASILTVAMRSQEEASLDVLHTWLARDDHTGRWETVRPGTETAALEALQTGRAVFFPDLAAYRKRFGDRELSLIAHDIEAVGAIPLHDSSGDVFGSIGFSFAHAQPFDAQQCGFLETVADVAGQSLDRARLYEKERGVAGALQIALLPSALPELDDVTTEARYIAGGSGVSVGGDWYDVLRFTDGRIGLLIGDAAGRGVEAATLMGKVRHAAAALAMDLTSPAAVLSRVNNYLHNISSRRSMLTCCYIVLDRDRGTLCYASAGHPPPLIVEDEGEPLFLEDGRGVPLGVVPTASYTEAEYQLKGPATIVLYTDGLIERRGETIDVGLNRLREVVRGQAPDARELCAHLTNTLISGGSDDDVALLVARVRSLASTHELALTLPAESRRLHELRTRSTRWLAAAGVPEAVASDIVVALNEAVSNSMLHAYTGGAARGLVRVSLTADDAGITALVVDEGLWRPERPRHDGRGLELMDALMSEVRIERAPGGTRVLLRKLINRSFRSIP